MHLNPFPHTQRQACHRSRSINARGVLHFVAALRVTGTPSAGNLGGIGTGNIKTSALRAGSKLGLRPASNRELALPTNT